MTMHHLITTFKRCWWRLHRQCHNVRECWQTMPLPDFVGPGCHMAEPALSVKPGGCVYLLPPPPLPRTHTSPVLTHGMYAHGDTQPPPIHKRRHRHQNPSYCLSHLGEVWSARLVIQLWGLPLQRHQQHLQPTHRSHSLDTVVEE